MKRPIQLAIPLLTVTLLAGVAGAQVVHDNRRKPPPPPPPAAVAITSFSPASGAAGTRIEVLGSGFAAGDQLLLGNAALATVSLAPNRIIAAIPAGATTGPLVLQRGGARLVASQGSFTVVDPAPAISALEPDHAPPGAVVVIRGVNLASVHSALLGKAPMKISGRGPDYLQVVVPGRAGIGDFVWVRGPGGEARSAGRLTVERLPVVRRVEPAYARPGDAITVFGSDFLGGDQLVLGGIALHISQLYGDRIVAVVPAGAAGGELALVRGGFRAVVAARFEVVQRPAIVAIDPPGGPAGTRVSVRVRNDSADLAVLFGASALPIARRTVQPDGTTDLLVTVPRGAADQVIGVRSRGGEDRWGAPFRVHVYPVMAGVTPARVWEKTQLTVTGRNLLNVDTFYLGATALPIASRSDTSAVLDVPAGTAGGTLTAVAYGQRFDTRLKVDVVLRALIDGFSPASGMPGSEVMVNGRNFTATTRVYLGNLEMPIVRATLPTQLWVQVPVEATGPERISVGEAGVLEASRDPFVAIAAPAISDFSPPAAKPGAEVVLEGNQLGGQVAILLGGTPLAITRVERGRIAVQLPATVKPGAYWFEIRAGRTVVARSRKQLTVLPPAVLRQFEPRRAAAGQQIHLKGKGFAPGTRVWFGATELPVVKVGPKGGQMWVQIPDGVAGTDYLVVDDLGAKIRSRETLTIDAPPPPPPPPPPPARPPVIHDNRKKHH